MIDVMTIDFDYMFWFDFYTKGGGGSIVIIDLEQTMNIHEVR